MKHLRQKNTCYLPTESDKTQQRNQGDDFILEQRIKRLKMIAPKARQVRKHSNVYREISMSPVV